MKEMVGTPRMIKLLNKDVIEGIIKMNGPVTKPEIAKITNLSLVTVNKTVESLLSENKVKASGTNESTGGRRAQAFEINEELYYVIGLYYGKNFYKGAISNTIGEIIYQEEFSVRVDTYEEVMEDTCSAIEVLLRHCEGHEVTAIGLGVPGVVNEGIVSNIPNIASWEGLNVSDVLEHKYGITTLLENDINLAAMGVYYSDYKNKVNNLVLLYLEQGIGSGLILNKELFKGSTNFAGELGYIPVHHRETSAGKKIKYKGNFENQIMLLNEELKIAAGSKKRELKDILRSTIADGLLSIICVVNPEI
ncbi:MAG: ROK family transcriptional regulator, partial [Clostridium sp.]